MSINIRIELRVPDVADAILAVARALRPEGGHNVRLAFGFPTSTRGDGSMANYQLKNDFIDTFPVTGVDDATQQPVPLPTGDTFTAASDNPAVNAVMGADASGAPTLSINATVQLAQNVTVTVSDSAGSKVATMMVDVVADVLPEDLVINTDAVTHAPQPVPAS